MGVEQSATYIDLMIDRLADRGDEPALRFEGVDIAASDFIASIHGYAHALRKIGMEPGKLVALLAPNRPDAIAVRYAASLCGAAASYLSLVQDVDGREALFASVEPDLTVVFPETADLCPKDPRWKVASVGIDLGNSIARLDPLETGRPGARFRSLAAPNRLGIVTSSGGVTGVPKGTSRSFATYTANVAIPRDPERRQLVNGPLANVSQLLVDMALLAGGVVVLEERFEPAATLALIEAERITDLLLVEPQLFETMDHPDVARRDLSSLRTLMHIGDIAAPVLRRRARERFGPILSHAYGASETGVVTLLPPSDYDPDRPERLSCAGRARPGVQIRFRREDGTLGEAGWIEVCSPFSAECYHKRPDLSYAFEDGWFRTGDFGELDRDGYLHVIGRRSEIAQADGMTVSAVDIQHRLCALPDIRFAGVTLDAETGTWMIAVVPWAVSSVDMPRCRRTFAAHFPGVRALIASSDRVPLTAQGKIDRSALKRLVERLVG